MIRIQRKYKASLKCPQIDDLIFDDSEVWINEENKIDI